jgi:hypothetical protein
MVTTSIAVIFSITFAFIASSPTYREHPLAPAHPLSVPV